MSQLNSKNSTKKTLMFLIIFTIICVGITAYFIYVDVAFMKNNVKNKNIVNEDIQIKNNVESNIVESKEKIKKVSLTDKYYTNGIIIEDKKISIGDIVEESEDYTKRKLEIMYNQISGLKNITVQEKINENIENFVLELRDDNEMKNSDIESIGIMANISANFSDVISVHITKSISIKDGESNKYQYEYYGLNYCLADGKEIKFNDLFTEDANIKTIMTQAIYNSLVYEYANLDDNLSVNMDEKDYGSIEDKVFKILNLYKQNPDLDFYFSSEEISILINNKMYNIKMKDYYQNIGIYTRFKTDNLYKDESLIRHADYVFANPYMSLPVIDSGKKTSNMYYEILTDLTEKSYGQEFFDNEDIQKCIELVKETIYGRLNKYAVLANKNLDKGYIFYAEYFVYKDETGKISYQYKIYLYSMDKKLYKENLEEIIADSYREYNLETFGRNYYFEHVEGIDFEESANLFVEDMKNPIETEEVISKENIEVF